MSHGVPALPMNWRNWWAIAADHVFTTSAHEAAVLVKRGFWNEHVTGYCARKAGDCGATLPLRRWYRHGGLPGSS